MPKKVLKPLQESILSSTKPFLWNGGASNETMSQQTNLLKNKTSTKLLENKRTSKKRYKQEKLNQKQKAMYDKLEKNMNERQARKKKELNE